MTQFAQESIVIGEGRYADHKYDIDRQPFNRQLLSVYDSEEFNTFVVLGCVQSGKTFTAWVLPILYHLFERGESVIAGVPTMAVAGDKYREEILPVIMANPEFRALLPETGTGSRGGGKFDSIKFKNDATLKFMSGQGRDENRSSFTARVVCATEIDKFDEGSAKSRESDPITQLINRTSSWGQDKRIYLECTASIPSGRIWQEYSAATESRLACPCPHCGSYVTPEREHFVDFQQPDIKQAGKLGRFVCPKCQATITDDERRHMNASAQLLHRGQTIGEDGTIKGDAPPTTSVGFRWNAFNNVLMWDSKHIAMEEWKGWRSEDDVAAEKESLQFRWAKPWEDKAIQTFDLSIDDVVSQSGHTTKSQIPEGTQFVTIGTDVGGKVLHWTVMAWLADGTGHIVDYGKTGVLSQKMGFENAIREAVRRIYDRLKQSYTWKLWYFDAHWKSQEVIAAIRELKDRTVRGSFGLGSAQVSKSRYHHPENQKDFTFVGKRMYEKFRKEYRAICMSCDADYWKTWLHEAFTLHKFAETDNETEIPEERKPAITLYESTDETEHILFAKHLTAEKQVQKFEKGRRGDYITWEAIRSANHWLDSTTYACVAGHRCGFRLANQTKPTVSPAVVYDQDSRATSFVAEAPLFADR